MLKVYYYDIDVIALVFACKFQISQHPSEKDVSLFLLETAPS